MSDIPDSSVYLNHIGPALPRLELLCFGQPTRIEDTHVKACLHVAHKGNFMQLSTITVEVRVCV